MIVRNYLSCVTDSHLLRNESGAARSNPVHYSWFKVAIFCLTNLNIWSELHLGA